MARFRRIVILDLDRDVREAQHLPVVDAVPLALLHPGFHGIRRLARASFVNHPRLFPAKRAAEDGAVALFERRLMNVELVWIGAALDDVFVRAIGAGDEDDVAKSGLRVEREDDPAR
jgi:hypothetical protein